MRKWWLIIVTFGMLIGGSILIHQDKIVLGSVLMLAGFLTIWTWALWPDIRNWFMNRLKH